MQTAVIPSEADVSPLQNALLTWQDFSTPFRMPPLIE
jgi:hypothetical protein